jgi:hypothetical protein
MTYSPPLPYHLDRMVIAKYLLKKKPRPYWPWFEYLFRIFVERFSNTFKRQGFIRKFVKHQLQLVQVNRTKKRKFCFFHNILLGGIFLCFFFIHMMYICFISLAFYHVRLTFSLSLIYVGFSPFFHMFKTFPFFIYVSSFLILYLLGFVRIIDGMFPRDVCVRLSYI